jgi:pyruvate/2-oxoacid:ferredoxin oxidoreductase beta subunit
MSSETSTSDQGLQPWQFFVLAALGCATAVTFVARGQGTTPVVLLGVLMATAGFVGAAVLRAVRPLVSPEDDRTAMIGQRTRAALEREKALALRSIKELEFDRAMGKLSESDWKDMSGRLRARTARLMRQLDAGSGFREQIEKDLARRLEDGRTKPPPSEDGRRDTRPKPSADRLCAQCSTSNDHDAKFCKGCGARL